MKPYEKDLNIKPLNLSLSQKIGFYFERDPAEDSNIIYCEFKLDVKGNQLPKKINIQDNQELQVILGTNQLRYALSRIQVDNESILVYSSWEVNLGSSF